MLNDAREVLVVQERRGPLRGKVGSAVYSNCSLTARIQACLCAQGIWKMPTGLINAGEDVPIGAAREVRALAAHMLSQLSSS